MSEPAKEPSESTALPSRPPNPPIRYKFIDASANSPASLTQVKRHVMREFVRQKKWQAQQRQDNDAEGDADISAGASTGEEDKVGRTRQAPKSPGGRKQATSDRKGKGHAQKSSSDGDDGVSHRVVDPDYQRDQLFVTPHGSGKSEETEVDPDHLSILGELGRDVDADEFNKWVVASSSGPLTGLLPFRLADPGYGPFGDSIFPSSESHPFFYEPFEEEYYTDGNDAAFHSSSGLSDLRSLSPWSPSNSASPMRLSPSPQTQLSAARTDPFDTLPMKLDEEGKILFDFYANVMPSCSYGFHTRSPNAHNWYLQVFIPEAMKGDICFQNTILVHAANTQAWVKGLSETPAALVHRARGIEMLRKHFEQNPTDNSDAAISATLSAAAVEDFDPRPERKPISWIHMRAAMQKIRARGGPAAFQQNQRMAMLINWQDYILAGYETKGPSFYYDHTTSLPTSENQLPTALGEIRTQCEEFISFLHLSERLSLTQKSSQLHQFVPSRYTAFQPDTLLFHILSSPPGIRYSIPGERKQIISRLAALMMINVAMWDHRNSPQKAETFLNGLRRKLLASEVDISSSVEALLQILLTCDDTFGFANDDYDFVPEPAFDQLPTHSREAESLPSGRPWFVGRMLKVAKRLGRPSWERLNNCLLSFLTLTAEAPVIPSWEDDLRYEILTAPLTSYIMPLLQ
ncbi:hypothetical protein AJ79_00722 [Helicocarpus griseus UAMH5409]|uniref:Sigma-70 region 2 family protein n=1 Tax=Helicocarpus griseus UAMH5409 TaxID=1447875 RepID=A0A2B7Y1Y8_9EURO|nr:hypothetical protein AJ79_00722 [Helicocarpus griseus UAMH5409]